MTNYKDIGLLGCLHPDCSNKEVAKGLCKHHYNIAYQLVIKGKVTWDKLYKQHKIRILRNTAKINKDKDYFLNK